MKVKPFVIAALLVLASMPATFAHATKYWKNSVVIGNWSNGNNWSAVNQAGADNGGVPVAGEPVVITHSDGTARNVTLDTSTPALGLLYLDLTGPGTAANTLTLSGNHNLTAGGGFAVGGNNGFVLTNGRAAVNQSAGTITISPGWDLILAWGSGSTGTYTLSGGDLVANQSEWIGYSGTATFNHSAGTNTINASAVGSFVVGTNAGSTGTYNLNGTGALVSHEVEYIGFSGVGNFNQTGGSNTITGAGNLLMLGYASGSAGTYNLHGGTLSGDNLVVGDSGTGTLDVATGGSISSDSASIGRFIGSQGNVLISGTGSTWTNDNDLTVAHQGLGTLRATGGADINTNEVIIGNAAGSSGSVTVDGSGSTWTATAPFGIQVGNSGSASLTIASSGQVSQTSGSTFVGIHDGAYGNVTVQDAGSTWTTVGALILGGHPSAPTGGDGYMTIRDGAQVASDTGYIGYSSGSNSGVSVDGAGSTWTTNSLLWVGTSGVGYLHITAGGKVFTNSFDANVGGALGTTGSGSVLVDGAGSAWTLPNTGASGVYVGESGPGSLTVTNGGVVSVASFNGIHILAQGTVTGNGTIDARVYNDGTVAPGTPTSTGTLTIANNPYRQEATGTLEIELASASSYDRLIFPDGGASLGGGTLDVTLIGGYSPSAGHSFDLMDWHQFGFISGTFDTLNLPDLPGTLDWDTSQLYSAGVLLVIDTSGLPGDFNYDGKVDAADYVHWRKGVGVATTEDNYNLWRTNFGRTTGSGAGATGSASADAAVPEPRTLMFWMMAMIPMFARLRLKVA